MKNLLILLAVVIPFGLAAQWDVIHYGGEESSDQDLFFQNTDTGFVVGYNADGAYVLRTHDGGAAWDSLWFADHQFTTIFMTSRDTGYIACFYELSVSVMRTIDAGESWQMIATDLATAVSVPYAISFFNNNTGIITLSGWASITTNAGISWEVIPNYPGGGQRDNDIKNNVFVGFNGNKIVWTLDFGNSYLVDTLNYYGSHYNLDLYDHRFISSAIGMHGTSIGFPTFNFGIMTIGDIINNEYNISYFPELIRIKGVCWASENTMYAIGNSIYGGMTDPKFFIKSIDGGETWFTQGTPELGYWNTDKIDCPNDSVCYAIGGYIGRIYKTTNGGGPLLDQVEQVVVSVKEIEDDLNFSIAPNPTSGQVTLRSETELIKEVKVFDLQGKELFRSYPNDFNVLVDLSKYDSGVYLIQIMAGDKIRTGRIVRE